VTCCGFRVNCTTVERYTVPDDLLRIVNLPLGGARWRKSPSDLILDTLRGCVPTPATPFIIIMSTSLIKSAAHIVIIRTPFWFENSFRREQYRPNLTCDRDNRKMDLLFTKTTVSRRCERSENNILIKPFNVEYTDDF